MYYSLFKWTSITVYTGVTFKNNGYRHARFPGAPFKKSDGVERIFF